MNDADEQLLRTALDQQADRLDVPPPPVGSLLTGGRAMARTRRVRVGIGVAAGVVAIALGGAVVAQPGLLQSQDPVGPASPSNTPEQTPTPAAPQTVADLPQGAAPELPYISRNTLHWRGTETQLGAGEALLRVGGDVIVTYRMDGETGWSVHLFDPASGRESLLTESADGPPVVSVDGRFAAWQVSREGKARVEVWSIPDGAPVTTVTFPFTPTCCDNPFLLIGIDAEGRVYGYGPLLDTTWVADVHAGPPQVVRELRGTAVGVTPDGLVARVDPTSKEEPVTLLLVGRVESDGSFTEAVEVTGDEAAVSDDGSSLAYVDQGGVLRVRDLVSADEQVMQLPEGVGVAGLVWEDATAVLVEAVPNDERADEAWVRCFADTGQCELATMLGPSPEVARR